MMMKRTPKGLRKLRYPDMILSQSHDYTLINKPPFLSCLEDRSEPLNLLSLARKENPEAQICHRIDKETSGLVVIANHNDAYKHFAGLLENREVKKIYHAVVASKIIFDDFEASEPIYTTTNRSRVDLKNGKPSLTLIQTLERFKLHCLVKCFPVSGRMHQIRTHLAFHDAPIVADTSYGGSPAYLSQLKRGYNKKEDEDERPMISRVALHSFQIAFKGLDGEITNDEAPYPKDFEVLVKQLRKFN